MPNYLYVCRTSDSYSSSYGIQIVSYGWVRRQRGRQIVRYGWVRRQRGMAKNHLCRDVVVWSMNCNKFRPFVLDLLGSWVLWE